MTSEERTITRRLSDDGKRLIIVERWLDRQQLPPRWRSKNRHVNLKPNEIEYHRQRRKLAANGAASGASAPPSP